MGTQAVQDSCLLARAGVKEPRARPVGDAHAKCYQLRLMGLLPKHAVHIRACSTQRAKVRPDHAEVMRLGVLTCWAALAPATLSVVLFTFSLFWTAASTTLSTVCRSEGGVQREGLRYSRRAGRCRQSCWAGNGAAQGARLQAAACRLLGPAAARCALLLIRDRFRAARRRVAGQTCTCPTQHLQLTVQTLYTIPEICECCAQARRAQQPPNPGAHGRCSHRAIKLALEATHRIWV